MNRRLFLKNTSLIAVAASIDAKAVVSESKSQISPKIRFGICADLHYDIMPDGLSRINKFIDAMSDERVDFIIQMGDFCKVLPQNQPLLDAWSRFKGPSYHVIGNHDTDGGSTREQVVKFWKMPAKYYSFDQKGYHFIVLDANEGEATPTRKYPSTLSHQQLSWLEKDLESTLLPVMVFVHQGLDSDSGVENAMKVRYILEQANSKKKKVHAVFSGHHHKDYMNTINGIRYIQINSMSNHFLGKKYMAPSFSEEILEKTPKLKEVCPYKEPLWATVTIDASDVFALSGQKSSFLGKSPSERGKPKLDDIIPAVPYVSDRKFNLTAEC